LHVLFLMRILMHNLEFNVGTGSIHQLPQTTGDGIHSLLQEVMRDVGDYFPNPVLQLFQFVRFCPVHLLLSPAPQGKVTGSEIWTSCRPFVWPSSSQRSFLNSQAAINLCCYCACCLSRPLPTPSTREL